MADISPLPSVVTTTETSSSVFTDGKVITTITTTIVTTTIEVAVDCMETVSPTEPNGHHEAPWSGSNIPSAFSADSDTSALRQEDRLANSAVEAPSTGEHPRDMVGAASSVLTWTMGSDDPALSPPASAAQHQEGVQSVRVSLPDDDAGHPRHNHGLHGRHVKPFPHFNPAYLFSSPRINPLNSGVRPSSHDGFSYYDGDGDGDAETGASNHDNEAEEDVCHYDDDAEPDVSYYYSNGEQ